MSASTVSEQVQRAVELLTGGDDNQKLQGALALRALAADAGNKQYIREAGGIDHAVQLLDEGVDSPLTVLAAETISCLAADDVLNRDVIRRNGGIDRLVRLLGAGADKEVTHRALLALRILTDKEADRVAIWRAGGIAALIRLLHCGPRSEVTEYAAAALGNIAAGSQQLKDAIRIAGGIRPLVKLIRGNPKEVSAELSAIVLRNLSLQNPANRQAIQAVGGLQPLLRVLSVGQDRLSHAYSCDLFYMQPSSEAADGFKSCRLLGTCCFDVKYGHLCVAPENQQVRAARFACFGGGVTMDEYDGKALLANDFVERYSMLRKLTIAEPDSNTLDINFVAADKKGVQRVPMTGMPASKAWRLQRIVVSPCHATEVKGALMRMLTRLHLEREFKAETAQAAVMATAQAADAATTAKVAADTQLNNGVVDAVVTCVSVGATPAAAAAAAAAMNANAQNAARDEKHLAGDATADVRVTEGLALSQQPLEQSNAMSVASMPRHADASEKPSSYSDSAHDDRVPSVAGPASSMDDLIAHIDLDDAGSDTHWLRGIDTPSSQNLLQMDESFLLSDPAELSNGHMPAPPPQLTPPALPAADNTHMTAV